MEDRDVLSRADWEKYELDRHPLKDRYFPSIDQKYPLQLTDGEYALIGQLVDADLAKESARLQALQVQQQLGAQALSIANSAPQIVLSLFRNG